MKFLITTKIVRPAEPHVMMNMMEGTKEWIRHYREEGKMEFVYSLAGNKGGIGLLNVDSNEELDNIMSEFPMAMATEIEVIPLTDVITSLEKMQSQIQKMMG